MSVFDPLRTVPLRASSDLQRLSVDTLHPQMLKFLRELLACRDVALNCCSNVEAVVSRISVAD